MRYPPADIVDFYAHRCQIELGFRKRKSSQLDNFFTLRSRINRTAMLNISWYRNTTLLILQSYSGIRRRGCRKLVSGLVKLEVQVRLHAANYTKRMFAVGLAF
jgi:IS4 transposase